MKVPEGIYIIPSGGRILPCIDASWSACRERQPVTDITVTIKMTFHRNIIVQHNGAQRPPKVEERRAFVYPEQGAKPQAPDVPYAAQGRETKSFAATTCTS